MLVSNILHLQFTVSVPIVLQVGWNPYIKFLRKRVFISAY